MLYKINIYSLYIYIYLEIICIEHFLQKRLVGPDILIFPFDSRYNFLIKCTVNKILYNVANARSILAVIKAIFSYSWVFVFIKNGNIVNSNVHGQYIVINTAMNSIADCNLVNGASKHWNTNKKIRLSAICTSRDPSTWNPKLNIRVDSPSSDE